VERRGRPIDTGPDPVGRRPVSERKETESPEIEIVREQDPDPGTEPSPDARGALPPDADDEHDEHDEEEPAWAALWSYETYEQVARKVLRAGTEVAREGYRRHDAAVVVVALALIVAGGVVHRRLLRPAMEDFDAHGLHFRRTAQWLAPEPVPTVVPRLIQPTQAPPRRAPTDLPYHVVFTSPLDSDVRLEVQIGARPAWSNILTGLELDRRSRYGELYASDGGRTRAIAGHDWLRTTYRYAYAARKGDVPRIGLAVEYATVDREQLYAVTFHGSAAQIALLEGTIAPSLRVASRTGVPLLPQNRVTQVQAPPAVRTVMASAVMVVVADVIDGRLRPAGGGSGVVLSTDGSIATNYHVIHDKGGRLHDVFVIGRHVEGRPPQLVCAGRPRRSKFKPEIDLALLKCDMDLDGRPWRSAESGVAWKPATPSPDDIGLGQRLWVLGYPDVGGGGITLSQGLVDGWTGEEQSLARDFIKTDASITHGSLGGPFADDQGRVVGIAAAFRLRITADLETVEAAKVGLVRPWSALERLVMIARVGWIPKDGSTSMEIEPTDTEVSPEGVLISTRIRDGASGRPVAKALLLILRSGLRASEIDINRLDDQVIAWGHADSEGEVLLKQPVAAPGTYSYAVIAGGYEPVLVDRALELTESTPQLFEPWGWVDLKPSL
jgi:hypothetical protein